MVRILELVGLLAPLAGLALLIGYRRSTPHASLVLGATGCVLATISVGVGALSRRVMALGALDGGGLDGMAGMLEGGSLIRLGLLGVAIVLLVIAALRGRGDRSPTTPWLVTAGVLLVVGLLIPLPVAEAEHLLAARDHDGLALILALLGETMEFGALGLSVLALAVAVTTGRRVDQGRDAAALVTQSARSAWTAYRALRR